MENKDFDKDKKNKKKELIPVSNNKKIRSMNNFKVILAFFIKKITLEFSKN